MSRQLPSLLISSPSSPTWQLDTLGFRQASDFSFCQIPSNFTSLAYPTVVCSHTIIHVFIHYTQRKSASKVKSWLISNYVMKSREIKYTAQDNEEPLTTISYVFWLYMAFSDPHWAPVCARCDRTYVGFPNGDTFLDFKRPVAWADPSVELSHIVSR